MSGTIFSSRIVTPAKIKVAKKENRYHDVFDVKKETLVTFNELADKYLENYKGQRSFEGFKRHVVRDLRGVFGERRLSELTYLDLETYRNKRKDTEVLKEVRREKQLKSPHVFCDSKGRRFSEVKRSFTSACKRAGLKDFRFHDLRHTFASHLVMNGVSLKAVQELLGHADIKMTMRYAHLSQAHLKDAVATLNNFGHGHQMDTNSRQNKKADSLTPANLL